jgi:hypothetical protein
MSKRTTSSPTPSDVPAPRRRAARQTDATAAAPKAPRTRRKASVPEAIVAAASAALASSRAPSHDEIATRAYYISLEQGADPLAAWLRAERELMRA